MPIVFTVRLKNEPGALAGLAAKLGEHGIDIRNVAAAAGTLAAPRALLPFREP